MGRINCVCCNRQIVERRASNDFIVGGQPLIRMFGNQYCCHECSKELDTKGLFPEERCYDDSE